jgi:hypothetical protein
MPMAAKLTLTHLSLLICLSLLVCLACGPEGSDAPCVSTAGPGDLVITEVLADPAGPDDGREWLEIANVSGVPQCLNGLFVEAAGATIAQSTLASDLDLIIMPGSFALLAGDLGPADALAYWERSFFLPGVATTVRLKRGSTVIDAITYGGDTGLAPKEGRSMALCAECLEAGCNDDPGWWQAASGALYDAAGNKGTPGSPNGTCACPAPPGTVAVRAPRPGDLLVTEIYANPPDTDGDAEWFEVKVVATDAALDLSGVGIRREIDGPVVATIAADLCLTGAPGDYLVLGRAADPNVNGGVTVDYAYGTTLTLANDGGYVGLVLNDELLAGYAYGAVQDGRSLSYDEAGKEWCAGTMPFGTQGGFATPGQANPACGVATCLDGGKVVTAQVPMPGEVEIVEVFPNTPGKEVPEREWFEVRVTGDRDVDLNGLEIWNDPDAIQAIHTIESPDGRCLRVKPGGYVLLARANETALNGLPAWSIIYVYESLSMPSEGHLILRYGGATIDAMEWITSEDGRAVQKDIASKDWCSATKSFWTTPENKLAFGTPGSPNGPCGSGATCTVDGSPQQLVHPSQGELVINEIFANPDGNDVAAREWLEVAVAETAMGKNLNGIELFVKGESKGVIGGESDACVTIDKPFLVVGKSADTGATGGVAVDIVLTDFALPNSDVSISMSRAQTIYDYVYYTDPADGAALQLDPAYLDHDANDDPEHWCDAKTVFNGTPEMGSPGVENPSCGAEFCTANGETQQLLKLYPDQVVITEIYANPKGADDKKEWFEIYVEPAVNKAHLNGVGILKKVGEEPAWTFATPQCIELQGGQYYVLCRSAVPEENGGLDNCIEYGSVTLVNSGGVIGLGKPGTLYDLVPSYGDASDGISRQLDPEHTSSWDNDSKDNWCDTPASATFADGRGSPGQKNPACP